jgi:hypothetical protein
MLNLSDKSFTDIIQSNMSIVYYLAIFGDKLYFTDYFTHTVTCCDLHSTTQWTLLLSISVIVIQLLSPYPDDTAMVLLSLI